MHNAKTIAGTAAAAILAAATLVGAAPWGLPELSAKTKACVECHRTENTPIYQQWGSSKHYRAKIGCYECHAAQEGDPDAFKHEGELIATIVSPKDCARCHEMETKQFAESHHSKGGRILGSLDNTLAEVVEGNTAMKTPAFPDGVSAAVVNGCWQCHGSEIKVLPGGKLDAATWPNTGIGRINPDGSEGSCAACHSRHSFSAWQARHPDACGKCHMGPDHPQKEIYEESKHGIAFKAFREKLNMDSPKWILGEDYSSAPTCATCHMSATKTQPLNHDIGLRISWNNRPGRFDPARGQRQEDGTARCQHRLEDPPRQHAERLPQLPRETVGGQLLRSVRQPGGALSRQVRQAGPRTLRAGQAAACARGIRQ
ncbi:MAG: multiheme c-type cytochrome [Phycisphaerae bacterium]|nr:multiheme c-type cytochrome [Phycisphaerae bacterium]